MKIKITGILPIQEQYRPVVGETYEVFRIGYYPESTRVKLFYIHVNGEEVGVFPCECEVVDNEDV